MRGHEHRCATGTHIADDRPHFPRALRIQAAGGSSSTSNSRASATLRPDPAAVAFPSSTRGSAWPLQRPDRPGRAHRRLGASPGGGDGPIRRVEAQQVVAPRQVRVERRSLDQCAYHGRARPALSGIGRPSTSMVPAVGVTRPSSIRIVVVLPDPLGPRNPKTVPTGTSRLRSRPRSGCRTAWSDRGC